MDLQRIPTIQQGGNSNLSTIVAPTKNNPEKTGMTQPGIQGLIVQPGISGNVNSNFLSVKKFAPEEMTKSIQKVLSDAMLFQSLLIKVPQKNVEQAVISLFSILSRHYYRFNRNLKDKKQRIGFRVTKTQKSKQA